MNVPAAVQQQLGFFRGITDGVVASTPSDALHARTPGSTVGSAASCYAHAVSAEDLIVHGMFQGKPSVFESGGWGAKLGIAPAGNMQSPEWAAGLRLDVPKFQEYAKAVYAATDAFLAGLTDADLQRTVQGPMGPQPLEAAIAGLLATHYLHHVGEVSALIGVQGHKGLPF